MTAPDSAHRAHAAPPTGASAVDLAALYASLARMGLIGASERPTVTELAGGVSSLIVRVDTAQGPVCLKRALPQLKVAAEWRAPVERNAAEVAYIKLATDIVPGWVPRIRAEDVASKSFAMDYLDPADYPVWKAQLRDGHIDTATATTVAANLARIHAATAHDDGIAKRFANDASFFALRLDPYFGAAARVHADCAPALQRLIDTTAATKRALVHGDVSPKNILVGRTRPVLLDAECAWYGDPAFDLAFVLNHMLLKCAWRPRFTARYLACFDALAASYLAGVNWENASGLEARTSRLLAAMLLARIDGKSPVEYIAAERERTRVRGFARHFLLAPAVRLDSLRNAWEREWR